MKNINNNILSRLIENKKHIVFDFDGVLVDSVEIKTKAFSYLYQGYGIDVANKVVKHHRSNGGMSRYDKFKYYHSEYLRMTITQSEIKLLDKKFSDFVVDSVINAPEISGANKFLKQVHESKKCSVCSATPEKEIKKIIKSRGWDCYFSSVYGSPSTKVENIKKIINAGSCNINDMIFFGDAIADLNASIECDIDFVGIGDIWHEHSSNKIVGILHDFESLIL